MSDEVARLRSVISGQRLHLSNIEAEWRFRALQQPIRDTVDPDLMSKYGDEFATLVFRLRCRSGQWPSVANVVDLFGHDHRYTAKASGQLLAAELERDGTALFLYLGEDVASDWCVMLDADRIEEAQDLYAEWEQIEEQLVAGIRRASQGDPDPFGIQAERR